MKKLKLHIENPFNGEFKLADLNFLFTFQVNCPGCFSYGFPLVESLREKYSNAISFVGISTAFEDYEYNNLENTKALVEHGRLVGETLKMFNSNGLSKMPYSIDIPIGMDKVADKTFDYENLAEDICQSNPNYSTWSDSDKKQMKGRIKSYLLQQELISLTFNLNQFRGTPTFVLFNRNYEILASWFGHVSREEMESTINAHISNEL